MAVNPSVLNLKILKQLGANLQHSNLGFFKMILHFVKCTILEKQNDIGEQETVCSYNMLTQMIGIYDIAINCSVHQMFHLANHLFELH